MSYLAWLDHSERERRQALDAVQALREQGTVDELGLGIVWEPLADLMFPGTSTIQTRARYFLAVPWIYRDLERRRTTPRDVATAAREAELALIGPLASSEDSQGTIGIQAGRSLKRLPSEVYWRGLELWGIRLFHGSRDGYHRWLTESRPVGLSASFDDGAEERSGWHAGLPPKPQDFPGHTGFELLHKEAAFLHERIRQWFPDSALAWLVDRETPSAVPFPWMHPELGTLSADQRRQVDHAEAFSTVMRGAELLYNVMLSEALGERDDFVDLYEDRVDEWRGEVDRPTASVWGWDMDDFWRLSVLAGARISPHTRSFVDTWTDLVRQVRGDVLRNERARTAVRDREYRMKRERARLFNRNALLRWSGLSGAAQIDYRWFRVQDIANDIIRGLTTDA